MKKLILVLAIIFIAGHIGSLCAADEPTGVTITAKQGVVLKWKDKVVKNLTTFETLKTKPVDGWGRWNALIDGWTLDAGFAWDTNTINNGALLLGRRFGTLGKYLPFLDFPLLNKVEITIYPVGIYIENLTDHPKVNAASGGAIIKATIKFG